jgi:hypothetical protein
MQIYNFLKEKKTMQGYATNIETKEIENENFR